MTLKKVSYFRNGRLILKEIDLQIEKGELIGLIGPNGAGKSTLLKLMMKIWQPTDGAISLNGKGLADWTQKGLAKQIAYLPQNPILESPFTCREVVLMGRYAHLGRFERESVIDYRIARQAMAQTRSDHLADRPVMELSGGERQRVLLARTLAQEAELLLLDEPTANLDPHYQLGLLDLIGSLVEKGITIVMAIHDLNLAARYADRLVLLHQGGIVMEGRPGAVLTPDHLCSVYGMDAEVSRHPKTNRLYVVPIKLERGNA
ncbi:MAG: heme ABC transporter ATP-binding protein [Nitrospiria bacterium]